MRASPTFLFTLGVFLSLPLNTLGGPVQTSDLTIPSRANSYKDAVKRIFVDSYSAYRQFAFGHDDLAPLSKGFVDGRNGWGATIVDAMSTMKIMGMDEHFQEAVDFVTHIDFSQSKTSDTVSVFESTIRYIGGLLSAYELSGKQYPVLVGKATQLADKLAFAWIDGSDIPFGHMDFTTNAPQRATTNIAEAGTLTLEWALLSKYTGNDTYRQLAERSARHIAQGQMPLAGLPGQGLDPQSGLPVGQYVTWGGGSDSYFEYLIKYARLNNTADTLFADAWRTAVDSSINTLMKTSTVGGHVYIADYDNDSKIRHVSSHLACFHGGNWIFGGKLLDNQTMVDIGLQLADACWNTYTSTATGIGPEAFAFISQDGDYTGGSITTDNLAFYSANGFYITASDYILRPEVLESNFYAWRATGDTKYIDRAMAAVDSFKNYLKVSNAGYAGLWDVNNINSQKIDDTESFWFAEVLKYLYLTFDDPSNISLDKYVFNTEAHPFQIPEATGTYGSGNKLAARPVTSTVPGTLPLISPLPLVGLL